jgi:hypothetical protein
MLLYVDHLFSHVLISSYLKIPFIILMHTCAFTQFYSYFFFHLIASLIPFIPFLCFNLVKHLRLRLLLDFLVCNLIIN